MNEEKIREALKIIKEPITVNSVNYKYFDEINYDKLIMVYDNCLWFANNLEQIISTVKQLEQENQQLKEKLEASERARKEGIELVNELADETDDTTCYEINKKRKEMIIDILDIDKGE